VDLKIIRLDRLISVLERIYQLYQKKSPCYELSAVSLLCSMWIDLYQILSVNSFESKSSFSPDIHTQKQMMCYIYENAAERLTLEDIARSGCISRTKCCQIFREYLNKTPMEFLNTYRLEMSMDMLRNSDLSVTEIAYNCGFHGLSYFSEIFKKYKGCTPSEYRNDEIVFI